MTRAAIFIDGAYMDNVLRDQFGGQRIDYHLLAQNIVQTAGPDIEILRVYYYHCLPYQDHPPTEEQKQRFSQMQRFFRALSRSPRIEVREGKLAFRGCDDNGQPIFVQKRVDLLLGVDLALLAGKRLINYAFLVAGDSDLIPAVRAAKNEGVVVYVVHGSDCHDDLLDEADERIEITDVLIGKSLRTLPP